MVADIRIKTSFLGHRKRLKLRSLLGPGSTDYLLDLWIRAAQERPDGVLTGMDDLDIALMAGWTGDTKAFCANLQLAGFLDQGPDGVFRLHDWHEHQAWVVGHSERVEQARRAARKRWPGSQDKAAEAIKASVQGQGVMAPVSSKMPEVGSDNGETMLTACGQHADRMPGACGQHAGGSAPLLSPSSSSTHQETRKTPPVRAIALTSPEGGGAPAFTKAFLAWWAVYPVKVKKPRAWAAWRKIKGVDAGVLIRAVQAQQDAGHHVYHSEEKWPHPSTWLKDRRWEDEIKPQGSGRGGSAAAKLKAMRGGGES